MCENRKLKKCDRAFEQIYKAALQTFARCSALQILKLWILRTDS